MELVSIIVPVYKVEDTLDTCIQSLVNQTYKNLEIIIIDDGSPDRCPSICDKWKKADSRIKVIHKQNGGLSSARNCGLKAAQGGFISFVDGDDYVSPLFIECLYNILKYNEVDIAIVDCKKVYDSKQCSSDAVNIKGSDAIILNTRDAIAELFLEGSYSNYMVNKLYNRKIFENIQFPAGRRMEDLGTAYKLFLKCPQIAYNPISLYYYYQRENSILHSPDKQFFEDFFVVSLERYIVLKKEYPDLRMNDVFMFDVLLYTYPYLDKKKFSSLKIKKLAKETFENGKRDIKIKKKIKYLLFCLNKYIYILIFKKC